MQNSLRHAGRITATFRQPVCRRFLETRRHASYLNPLNWVKEKLVPGIRERETKEEMEANKRKAIESGKQNVFESAKTARPLEATKKAFKPKPTSHKYSTANFKISPRKLNMLGRQISGKPIDYAILQMQFSEKRASNRVMNMLATARDHAVRYKRLNEPKLIIAEAWVSKGPRGAKQLEPRGRGHYGIRTHPNAKLNVVLKEGKTIEEKKKEDRERRLRKIVSAGIVREDRPLRNPAPTWSW